MSDTFFTDRDLGRAFPARLRQAGILVEEHVDHFAPETPDTEWLETVGRHGWFVLTHDRRIRYRPNERDAVLKYDVGMFILIGTARLSELADNFITSLGKIERFIERHERPFIAKIYRPTIVAIQGARPRAGHVELWLGGTARKHRS